MRLFTEQNVKAAVLSKIKKKKTQIQRKVMTYCQNDDLVFTLATLQLRSKEKILLGLNKKGMQ